MAANTEQELKEFLHDTGLTPTYIVRQMLETANLAKDAGKFDIAAKTYKDIGGELFGMFVEKKHLSIDQQSVHTSTTTTLNLEGLNQALERLAGPSPEVLEIDGVAERIERPIALLPPFPIDDD